MKFFTAFASATVVSAIDFANLALIQAAQGNQGAAGGNLFSNPLVLASMLDKDSSSDGLFSDPLTLMALSGGNLGGNMNNLFALSLLDKTGNSDDSFSSLMTLQAMNGGEFPQLNYWNKRK